MLLPVFSTLHSSTGAEEFTRKMNEIPKDPFILFSWINLKLRDYYPSLDALCEDLELDKESIIAQLSSFGFEYDSDQNRFR